MTRGNEELERKKLELRMRLHDDLQHWLLDDALDEMHPALIQMTLVKFLRTAAKKKNDPRIVFLIQRQSHQGQAHTSCVALNLNPRRQGSPP